MHGDTKPDFPLFFFGPSWCDSTAKTVRSPSDPPNFPAQSSIHVARCFGSRELGWFGKRHAFWGSIGVDEGAWYLGRSQGKLSFCVKWKLDEKMTFRTSNKMVTITTRIAFHFHLPSSHRQGLRRNVAFLFYGFSLEIAEGKRWWTPQSIVWKHWTWQVGNCLVAWSSSVGGGFSGALLAPIPQNCLYQGDMR